MKAGRKSQADWALIVRPAEERDLDALQALENSAGMLFREIPTLAWLADGEDLPISRYRELLADGASWVAVDEGDRPIGFLCASIETDALHIWEVGVRRDWQRQGIGRSLIVRAIHAARRSDLPAVTLTTFRDVPWNAPFYANLGFETLAGTQVGNRLKALLSAEVDCGLPLESRCAMRLKLGKL
jgi:GNAT superfamily N-acetyltransferase